MSPSSFDPQPLLRLLSASPDPVDGSENSYRLPNGCTLQLCADTHSRYFGRHCPQAIHQRLAG
jgi:hypothetical protein